MVDQKSITVTLPACGNFTSVPSSVGCSCVSGTLEGRGWGLEAGRLAPHASAPIPSPAGASPALRASRAAMASEAVLLFIWPGEALSTGGPRHGQQCGGLRGTELSGGIRIHRPG